MKRIISLVLVIVLFALGAGCTTADPGDASAPTKKPTAATAEPAANDPTEKPATEEPTQEPTPAAAFEVTFTNAVVYKNSIGTPWVHIVVQIENTGSLPLYLSSSTIDLEDANEHLVDTFELVSGYPEVLLPGECALFVEDTTLDEDPGVDTLTVLPHIQAKKATVDCIRFETSDEELLNDKYLGLKLKGRVKNTSDETQDFVYVIANLYDAEHHGIAQLMTILSNDIAPGDKIGFELGALSLPDSITVDSVASFEVFAFPIQYQFDW